MAFINALLPNSLANAVSFGEPKVNASGGKNVAIFNSAARAILTIEAPAVDTYGVNTNNFDAGKPATYDMTLQLNQTDECMTFMQNLIALEKRILDEAFKNSAKWFGKKMSAEVLQEFWTPFVKWPKKKGSETGELDLSKSPTIRLKLSHFDGAFKYVEVFNTSNQKIFPASGAPDLPELIPKGSRVKTLFRCNGIWFAGGKFGMTCKPVQIIVEPKARVTPGVCLISMSASSSARNEDDRETEDVMPAQESNELKVSVEDSDEDEDPDKEYATPVASSETPASATGADVPPPPVKRRPRVNKKDDP